MTGGNGRRTGIGRLPGDPSAREIVDRTIRVDHAGEYGVRRLYEGQLAVLGRQAEGVSIRRAAEQEAVHLRTLERMMVQRRVRPTALFPLWHVAGFALGAASALMGSRAATACAAAAEEEMDRHYARQTATLGDDEADLRETIDSFRAEEGTSRGSGRAHAADSAPGYPLMRRAVGAGCRLAIWLSERV